MTRSIPFLVLALASAALAGPGAVPPEPLATGVGLRSQFTPDGEAVVYHRGDSGELILRELSSGEERTLSAALPETAKADWFSFYPDPAGTGVVFASVAREWAGYTCPDRDLYWAPRDGGPAKLLGECYSYEFRLDREGFREGSPWLVFAAKGGEEGVGLYASRFDGSEKVRLDAPLHDGAKVVHWSRHGTDLVAFVTDAESPGDRQLYLSDLAKGTTRNLTAQLPDTHKVCERLGGRSDVPGDKDPAQFSPDGSVVAFAVQPTDAGIGEYAALWAVDVAGGAPRELFPATTSWGTQSFRFSPDGKWVCLRNFDQGMSIGVAAVRGDEHRFVHQPPVGWQWTNTPMIPAGSDRVWFWGDVESEDQETFLYSASLFEDDLRREELDLPIAPDHPVDVIPTPDGSGVVIRSQVKHRKGFRLLHVPYGSPGRWLSEDNRYGDVERFEQLSDDSVVFLEGLHTTLPRSLSLVRPGQPRVTVSPELPPWDGVVAFQVDPTETRVAVVLRKKKEETRLVVLELAGR